MEIVIADAKRQFNRTKDYYLIARALECNATLDQVARELAKQISREVGITVFISQTSDTEIVLSQFQTHIPKFPLIGVFVRNSILKSKISLTFHFNIGNVAESKVKRIAHKALETFEIF